jgi:hypothetical protein
MGFSIFCTLTDGKAMHLERGERNKINYFPAGSSFPLAFKKMVYSGAHVARFLGTATSGVNRLAAFDVLSDAEKYY